MSISSGIGGTVSVPQLSPKINKSYTYPFDTIKIGGFISLITVSIKALAFLHFFTKSSSLVTISTKP